MFYFNPFRFKLATFQKIENLKKISYLSYLHKKISYLFYVHLQESWRKIIDMSLTKEKE